MGQEVNFDLLKLIFSKNQELDARLNSIISNRSDDLIFKTLVSFAHENIKLQMQLGIGVGSIIVINPVTRELITLFNLSDNSSFFTLPYTNVYDEIHENILNNLFGSWRECESLGQAQKCMPYNRYPPEYTYFLPMLKSQTINDFSHEDEQLLSSNFVCVSPGEMLFFMLIWRFLTRCIQYDIFCLDDLLSKMNTPCHLNLDKYLSKLYQHGTAKEKSFSKKISSFNSTVLSTSWQESFYNVFDNSESWIRGFIHDMELMKLIDVQDEQHISFGKRFTVLCDYIDIMCKTKNIQSESWTNILCNASKEKNTNYEIVKLIENFISLIKAIFTVQHTPNNQIKDILESLHRYARFPIIPYFYWLYQCNEMYVHCVIPIWKSCSEEYVIHNCNSPKCINTSSCDYCFHDPPDMISDVVAFAVLGVSEETIFNLEAVPFNALNDSNFYLIKSYFSIFAPYIIDLAFYERVQNAKFRERFSSSVLHSRKNQVGLISSAIVVDTKDYSKNLMEEKFPHTLRLLNYFQKHYMAEAFLLGKKSQTSPTLINLNDLLNQTRDLFMAIDINLILPSHANSIMVYCYPEILELILFELINNAIKHNEDIERLTDRELEVGISVVQKSKTDQDILKGEATSGENGFVLCKVYDNGLGFNQNGVYSGGLKIIQEELKSWHFNDNESIKTFSSDLWIEKMDPYGSMLCFNLPIV